MKMTLRNSLFAVALSTLIFSSCEKTEDVVDDKLNNNTNTTTNTSPNLKDGYGMLAAVTSVSYTTVQGITVPVSTNTATAGFFSALGASNMVDAGTVTLNSKTLTKSSNNAYVYDKLTDPLSFSQVTWNVTGSSGVAAINYTDDKPMPDFSGYNTLPATVTKANGLTVALGGSVSNADSVYVIVTGGNNQYVLKRMGGNASQCTFSASDLSVLSNTTTGMIQVAPWNYKKEDFNDKPYYFVLETVYSKIGVTIN
jgi:hypothetical protein